MFVLFALAEGAVAQYLRSTAGLLNRAVVVVVWGGKTILEFCQAKPTPLWSVMVEEVGFFRLPETIMARVVTQAGLLTPD